MDFERLYYSEVGKSSHLAIDLAETLKELNRLKQGVLKCKACKPLLLPNVNWVSSSMGNVPVGSFAAGSDHGQPLFIARCQNGRSLVPGKLNPTHSHAWYAWEDTEMHAFNYDVLVVDKNAVVWVPTTVGKIPANAVPGGKFFKDEDDYKGEVLYIGRATHLDSGKGVGKIHSSHGLLYISYGHKTIPKIEFEVLCFK